MSGRQQRKGDSRRRNSWVPNHWSWRQCCSSLQGERYRSRPLQDETNNSTLKGERYRSRPLQDETNNSTLKGERYRSRRLQDETNNSTLKDLQKKPKLVTTGGCDRVCYEGSKINLCHVQTHVEICWSSKTSAPGTSSESLFSEQRCSGYLMARETEGYQKMRNRWLTHKTAPRASANSSRQRSHASERTE